MDRRFIVRPLAEADLEDAARWYDAERAGLSARFLGDVDRTFSRIAERPLQTGMCRQAPSMQRGLARRYFSVTGAGIRALNQAKTATDMLWHGMTWPLKVRT